MTASKKWTKTYRGPSRDERSNRWSVTCPNGHTFDPPTTIKRYQQVTCQRCQESTVLDYNDDEKSITKGAP